MFTFDPASQRYRNARTGQFVSEARIHEAVVKATEASAANVKTITEQLRLGQITLADWQTAMAAEIKQAHLASVMLANGGRQQMTQASFGYAGRLIRTQYEYLRTFAEEVASGKQRLDGTLNRRAGMYVDAARGTFYQAKERQARLMGHDEERNVLGVADHCDGCVGETARGWVKIGELVPIGQRECRTNCRCRITTRRAA